MSYEKQRLILLYFMVGLYSAFIIRNMIKDRKIEKMFDEMNDIRKAERSK